MIVTHRRTTVDDGANRGTMALAVGGDTEESTVGRHGLGER